MSKVFLVSRGCYSDFHIIAAFSTKQKAEEFIRLANSRRCATSYDDAVNEDVDECEVDADFPALRSKLPPFRIYMHRNGDVIHATSIGLPWEGHDGPLREPRLAPRYALDGTSAIVVECFARDEQHAIKIANEKRTQFIAEGKWP